MMSFFFQAEDGIRDLVRSRGLGDVYKRQIIGCITARGATINEARRRVYRTIRNTVQSDIVQFRQDIGQIEDEQIKQLREWGWLE